MTFDLCVVRIFVTDWDRALAFYSETVGLPVSFSDSGMGWAELGTGQAHLALDRADPDDAESMAFVGRFTGVSLRVEDLHATYDSLLARGVEFLSPPEEQPWGGVLAHFRDPDGNVLTLIGS